MKKNKSTASYGKWLQIQRTVNPVWILKTSKIWNEIQDTRLHTWLVEEWQQQKSLTKERLQQQLQLLTL